MTIDLLPASRTITINNAKIGKTLLVAMRPALVGAIHPIFYTVMKVFPCGLYMYRVKASLMGKVGLPKKHKLNQ